MEKFDYRIELYFNNKLHETMPSLLAINQRTEEEAQHIVHGIAVGLHLAGRKNFYINLFLVNTDGTETLVKKQQ